MASRFPFLDLTPMSGVDLRALRGRLGDLLGAPVRQGDLAPVLGTNQSGYSAWENADVVPHRVAMVARLVEAQTALVTTPRALRPDPAVLASLADVAETVATSYRPGEPLDALRLMALSSAPPLVAWLEDFRAHAPVPVG